MTKPIKMWAIKYSLKRGGSALVASTVRSTRAEAIEKFLEWWRPGTPWRRLYRCGYRAVRVEVREIDA